MIHPNSLNIYNFPSTQQPFVVRFERKHFVCCSKILLICQGRFSTDFLAARLSKGKLNSKIFTDLFPFRLCIPSQCYDIPICSRALIHAHSSSNASERIQPIDDDKKGCEATATADTVMPILLNHFLDILESMCGRRLKQKSLLKRPELD